MGCGIGNVKVQQNNINNSVLDIVIESFRPHYGPGVDPDSNRNEYQEYFLGVKAASAWG
jgi:hypothetical protein